jgi:hypothetical protein
MTVARPSPYRLYNLFTQSFQLQRDCFQSPQAPPVHACFRSNRQCPRTPAGLTFSLTADQHERRPVLWQPRECSQDAAVCRRVRSRWGGRGSRGGGEGFQSRLAGCYVVVWRIRRIFSSETPGLLRGFESMFGVPF